MMVLSLMHLLQCIHVASKHKLLGILGLAMTLNIRHQINISEFLHKYLQEAIIFIMSCFLCMAFSLFNTQSFEVVNVTLPIERSVIKMINIK